MRILTAALTGAALLATAFPAMAKTPVGSPAPYFSVVDTNGVPRNLESLRGKTVVLEWTNAGCPYVKKHYSGGNMQDTQKALVDNDTIWLSVISSARGKQGHVDAAGANALTASRGAAPSGVVLDPNGFLGRKYDAKTTPHMYVIDPSGTLVYQGAIDSNRSSNPAAIHSATNYVKAAIADLEAGRPVSVPDTQPYGCTIKY